MSPLLSDIFKLLIVAVVILNSLRMQVAARHGWCFGRWTIFKS